MQYSAPHTPRPIDILIAEDSPTQAEQLRQILTEAGYVVRVATNGKLALQAALENAPDVLLSDVMMPVMNGYELCRNFKSNEALKPIPVVLLTSLSSPSDVILGLEAGADNFLRKPYDARYLLQRLQHLVTNKLLRQNERVQLGIEIYLDNKRHFITAERQQILDLLISTYDEAIHLNKSLERSNQSLNGLYRVAEGLNECISEQDVLSMILDRVLFLPGVVAGWVFLKDQRGEFHVEASRGLPPALTCPHALEGMCQCLRQLEAGTMDRRGVMIECERLTKAGADAHRLRYHVSVPLWTKNEVIGVMNLAGEGNETFDDDDLRNLYGVGNQVGQALERARLHQNLEQLVAKRTQALQDEITVRKKAEQSAQLHALRAKKISGLSKALTDAVIGEGELLRMGALCAQEVVGEIAVAIPDPNNPATWYFPAENAPGGPSIAAELSHAASCCCKALRESAGNAECLQIHFFPEADSDPSGTVSIRAALCCPVLIQGQISGAVAVFSYSRTGYEEDEQIYLNDICIRIAEAAAGRKAYEQLRDREAELQRISQRLMHLLEVSPTAIFALIREKRTFVPAWVSENIELITGWPSSAALHADWWANHLHPEDRLAWEERLPHLLEAGEHAQDYRFQRPDGEYIWLRSDVRVLDGERQEAVDAVGSLTDITKRKAAEEQLNKVEEQLRQSQKLESIGSLAGGIAHDLNNVFSAINGYAELRVSELSPDHPLYEDLQVIHQAGEKGASLVQQILAFARQQVIEPRNLQMNTLVSDFTKLLSRLLGNGIELRTNLQEDLALISADKIQIEQILMNLVVNARDAMPEGGTLTVETSNATLDDAFASTHVAVVPGRYVMLAVCDTGMGMTKEVQERLFEPFYTTKEIGKGTGLGLSTVYGIVKQHSGSIWVYSELGHGTTFKIYLPAVGVALPEDQMVEPSMDASGEKATLLVAEDDVKIRELIVKILQRQGYAVITDADPLNLIEAADEFRGKIDLLITDVMMPGLSGHELYQKLSEARPELRVLFLSGYTQNSVDRVIQAGNFFLQKPFTMKGLIKKVQEAIESAL